MVANCLRILFLGSGSAFTVGDGNYHSNLLLMVNNSTLLIDCGSDIRFSLHEQHLSFEDIDHVYISHLHADHVGGLEWLGYNRKFNSSSAIKPILYISEDLVNTLWENVLSGCMSSLEDETSTLESFYTVRAIVNNRFFMWQGISFRLIRTLHTHNNNILNPSYGLFFEYAGTIIFITTDTKFAPEYYKKLYAEANIIFHDCETTKKRSGVHSHYSDLKILPPEIKKKIWLYHYNSGILPNAVKDGFRGFIQKGQCITLTCK